METIISRDQIRQSTLLGSTVVWKVLYELGGASNHLVCCQIVGCEAEPTFVGSRYTLLAVDVMQMSLIREPGMV